MPVNTFYETWRVKDVPTQMFTSKDYFKLDACSKVTINFCQKGNKTKWGITVLVFEIRCIEDHAVLEAFVILHVRRSLLTTISNKRG